MWSRKQQLMEEWQRLCETETRMDEEVTPSSLSISTERAEEENRRLKEQVELAKKELEKTKTATVGPTIDDLRASILKTRAARDETKYEVSRMADRIRRQRLETLDVAFVMDASGSMGRYIDAASSKTIQIASWITSEFPEIKSRFAFVAYRDHSNGRERIESKDFCTAEQVSSFASRVKSIRNTDTPEDVLGGLEAALNLDWQAATRLIVWIGDSPCHGSVYHTDEDDYPHGCPRGLTPESILKQVKAKNIDLAFGKITSDTDKMISAFQAIFNDSQHQLIQVDMKSSPDNFMAFVKESIRHTIRASTVRSFK